MENVKYASFWRRLFANFIDSFILMAIGFGISFALGRNPFAQIDKETQINSLVAVDYIFTYSISAFFVLFFWVKHNGQTPGKKAMHIKIVKEDGSGLDWGTAVVRYLSMFVSMVTFYLGFLWVIWDKKKQGFHDKIAKTVVIEADEQKPNKAIYGCGCLAIIIFLISCSSAGFLVAWQKAKNPTSIATRKLVNFPENLSPEARKHWDRSVELFAQMKELQKQNPSGLKEKITALNDENINELKAAIEIEPNNARIWSELGAAYTWFSSNGTPDDALLAYKKATEIEPESVVLNNYYGDELIRQGKYDEAVLVLQKSIRLFNDSGYAYKSLGTAYVNLKVYDQARENWQKAVEIFQKQNSSGKFDSEILDIQKALAIIANK